MNIHETEDSLVVRLVEHLLHNALAEDASDIHIEPQKDRLNIRYRIDGILVLKEPVDCTLSLQIIARLKILARINTVQRKIPQDGKFSVAYKHRSIDVRMSTFPSLYGENVVLRLLDQTTHLISLAKLGLSAPMQKQFIDLLNYKHGLILVTGPTGSGKTTTLYAALNQIKTAEKNIITLEDPVEYAIDGITQGYIDLDVGFTFEKGIRAMLRQDPDILLIGEIRDAQTAAIAIEAALTGHLVLSTLHTNNAPSAIIRLIDIGIKPFLINAALIGVLAQRLARTVCTACSTSYKGESEQLSILHEYNIDSITEIKKGSGCSNCRHTGYKGRTGIFELLTISHQLRSHIIDKPNITNMHATAHKSGMVSLKDDLEAKLCNGLISFDECISILLSYEG